MSLVNSPIMSLSKYPQVCSISNCLDCSHFPWSLKYKYSSLYSCSPSELWSLFCCRVLKPDYIDTVYDTLCSWFRFCLTLDCTFAILIIGIDLKIMFDPFDFCLGLFILWVWVCLLLLSDLSAWNKSLRLCLALVCVWFLWVDVTDLIFSGHKLNLD